MIAAALLVCQFPLCIFLDLFARFSFYLNEEEKTSVHEILVSIAKLVHAVQLSTDKFFVILHRCK